jgi:hypothetical protein
VAYACTPDIWQEPYCPGDPDELAAQRRLVDEVFGNPFRPATLEPALLRWNGGTIPRLAAAAYDERTLPAGALDPVRLAVLGDALEDAGCTDPSLLAHLRVPGPHVRGCWTVDLLSGRA